MGYEKVFITLIKYSPQIYWNYKRKSTVKLILIFKFGWSIYATLFDLTGGLLSFIQSIIDKLNNDKAINVVKLLLGFISLFFDLILMTQHYILYSGKKDKLMVKYSIKKFRPRMSHLFKMEKQTKLRRLLW